MAMELSPAIVLAWQIAVYEAAQAKHQYIEIEHIFIGLCKVREVLRPEVMEKMALDGDIEELEIEIDVLDGLFSDFGLEPTALRRKLRGMLEQGEYEHTEKGIHRSPKCKEFFKKAEEIAASYSAGKSCTLHLLLAILEEPGDLLSEAISRCGIEIEEIKKGVTKRVKEDVPLTKSGIKKVLNAILTKLETRLKAQGIDIKVENEAIEFLCNKCYNGKSSEREVKKIVKRELEDRLKDMKLKKKVENGEGVLVCVKLAIINVTREETE